MARKIKTREHLRRALTQLPALSDPVRMYDIINQLPPLSVEFPEAREALVDFIFSGAPDHVRAHAAALLAHCARETDGVLREAFHRACEAPELDYWAVEGLARAGGRSEYETLITIAFDTNRRRDVRSHAIKWLATLSGQRFDRDLSWDPGYWKESDLRLDEIIAWRAAGYPEGTGYAPPPRDPALDDPRSPLERAAAALDRKLAGLRAESQDAANPTNWLSPPAESDLATISARWPLPTRYLEFLRRFSPVRVSIPGRRYITALEMFGAADLMKGQVGYSVYSNTGERIESWPAHFLVIAADNADPYVLDLSQSNGVDAPVLYAMHDYLGDEDTEGEFDVVSPSFLAWLRRVGR
ncbi:MAG: hypothetical protein AMXMBFR47_41410 [Planctomycetota bacterium]